MLGFLRGETQSNTKSLGEMSEIVGGFIAILCKTCLASFEEYKIARERYGNINNHD